jgi:hypothetical protein
MTNKGGHMNNEQQKPQQPVEQKPVKVETGTWDKNQQKMKKIIGNEQAKMAGKKASK